MHQVSKCPSSRHKKTTISCFKFNTAFSFLVKLFVIHTDKTKADFSKLLYDTSSELVDDKNMLDHAINVLLDYFAKMVQLVSEPRRKIKPVYIKLADININLFPTSKLKINWMKIFNNFYLKSSQISSDKEEVLIQDSEVKLKFSFKSIAIDQFSTKGFHQFYQLD